MSHKAQNLTSPAFQKKYLPSLEEGSLQLKRATTSESSDALKEGLTNGEARAPSSADPVISQEDGAPDGDVAKDTGLEETGFGAEPLGASGEMMTATNGDLSNGEAKKSGGDAEQTGQSAGEDSTNELAKPDEPEDDQFGDDEEYIADGEPTRADGPSEIKKPHLETRYELTHWAYHLQKAESLWSREERESNSEWAEVWKSLTSFMCDSPEAF